MKTLKSFFTSTINHYPSSIIHHSLYIAMFFMVILIGCSTKESNEKDSTIAKEYWTCPMHLQITADRPGVCPICNMDLIKKISNEKEEPAAGQDMANMVTLSGKKQVLANVSTVIVKKENLQEQVTAYSYLDFVENNRKTISRAVQRKN